MTDYTNLQASGRAEPVNLDWGSDICIGSGRSPVEQASHCVHCKKAECVGNYCPYWPSYTGLAIETTEPTVGAQSDWRTNPITEMSERENT